MSPMNLKEDHWIPSLDQKKLFYQGSNIKLAEPDYLHPNFQLPYDNRISIWQINDTINHRLYGVKFANHDNDTVYLMNSVTTAIKSVSAMPDTLLKWYCSKGYDKATAYLNERSVHGDTLHDLYQAYLTTTDEEVRNELRKDPDCASFALWCDYYKVKPLAMELPVFHYNMKIAGNIDLVCKMTIKGEEVQAIVDFKHGKDFYHEHLIQLLAYDSCLDKTMIDYYVSYRPTQEPGGYHCRIRKAVDIPRPYIYELEAISELAAIRNGINSYADYTNAIAMEKMHGIKHKGPDPRIVSPYRYVEHESGKDLLEYLMTL